MKFTFCCIFPNAKDMNLYTINQIYNKHIIGILPDSSSTISENARVLIIMLGDEIILKMDKDGRICSNVSWDIVNKDDAKSCAYEVLQTIVRTISA